MSDCPKTDEPKDQANGDKLEVDGDNERVLKRYRFAFSTTSFGVSAR